VPVSLISVVIDLASHLAILSAVMVAYSLIVKRLDSLPEWKRAVLGGGLFGLAAIFVMLTPIEVGEGIFFDMRAVILGLTGPFLGTAPALIAGLIAGGYRLGFGGIGAFGSAIGIALAALIGISLSNYLKRRGIKIGYRHLVLLSLLLVLHGFLTLAFLPAGIPSLNAIQIVLPTLLVFIPLGTTMLGSLLLHERHRHELEHALAESEARNRLFAAHATDMITRVSFDGVRLYASPAAQKLLGYTVEEIVGQSIFDIIHPDDVARSREAIKAMAGGAANHDVTVRLIRKDGSTVWVEARMSAIADSKTGKPSEILTVVRDISRRKALEQALAEKTNFLQTTLENMNQGLVAFDANFKLILANRNYQRIFEYPDEFVTPGVSIFDVIRYDIMRGEHGLGNQAELFEKWAAFVRRNDTFAYERIRPSGTTLHVESRSMPDGTLVATFTDITEAKRREQALEQSQMRLQSHVSQIELTKDRLELQGKELAALAENLAAAKQRSPI